MITLARDDYTAEQVKAALHAAHRLFLFRYDLLDAKNVYKATLRNVTSGSVAYNALAEIKRTAKFTVKDDGSINFLSDRIKPWCWLKMADGSFAKFPLGVFLLSSPDRGDRGSSVIRDIEAYDQLQVLADDSFEDRYTVQAGTNYRNAVSDVLISAGIPATFHNLTATDKVLPADLDWDPETSKLKIINDLLGAINYRSLFFDENGFAVATPYAAPSLRASEYTYTDDDKSVIFHGVTQTLDLFKVPNKWTAVVSSPDRPSLKSVYVNSDPNSPTSTVSRERTIPRRLTVDAADQETLDRIVERHATEDTQAYEQVEFSTAIMPMHGDSDVLTLGYSKLDISEKFSEVGWEFDLRAGAQMKHRVRRVVKI